MWISPCLTASTIPPSHRLKKLDERVNSLDGLVWHAATNNTGVAIDLDLPGIPPGTYPYLRITAPIDNNDNQLEIDALVAIPVINLLELHFANHKDLTGLMTCQFLLLLFLFQPP